MAARRQYVSGCRHPLFPLAWRHWREVYKDSLAFSGNYYFPLTGWKTSVVHELHDERPAYGFDLRTKGTLPDFPGSVAS